MLISAALIVRDESAMIEACLASIVELVDEVVVVDTGSVDDTREIAARYGARVIDHPWTGDFAQARNVGLDAARGDWILYIDADERAGGIDRAGLETTLTDAPEVAFRVLLRPDSVSTPYLEYRIWRHEPRIRFRGRMHEKVTPAISEVADADGRPIGDCALLLTHLGYEGDQTHKHLRNLPLLRAQLADEPENLFNLHHLARVLSGLDRGDEAAEVLESAVGLARERPWDHLGSLVYVDLIRLRRSRDEGISGLLADAFRLYPGNKLLWWVEGAVDLDAGRFAEALASFDRLLAVDVETLPNQAEGSAYDERIFGEFSLEGRGNCLFRLGRYEEAAEAYAAAARANPDNLAYRAKQQVAAARAAATAGAR